MPSLWKRKPALEKILQTNEVVDLSDRRWSNREIGEKGAQEIARALCENERKAKVQTLNLSFNHIGPAGAKAIAEALVSYTPLTTLNLCGNDIGIDGAKAIGEALKNGSTALTTLDLRGNKIGIDGAKAIAKAMKSNTSLTTLSLYGNEIGNDGAKAIAEALKKNTTLTALYLNTNDIGNDGAKAIAEALTSNTTLTTQSLGYNKIGNDGAKAIAEALKENTTLTTLHLDSNEIGIDGVLAIAKALTKNTTLTTMNLSNNKIGNDCAYVLVDIKALLQQQPERAAAAAVAATADQDLSNSTLFVFDGTPIRSRDELQLCIELSQSRQLMARSRVQTECSAESVLALQQVDATLAGLCALPRTGDNVLPALEAYRIAWTSWRTSLSCKSRSLRNGLTPPSMLPTM